MTNKLILTRGIQASGKTTWSKKWVNADPEHRVRFCNDDIRNMYGKYWVPKREPLVSYAKTNIVIEALLSGYDVVVDNMNLNPKEWNHWESVISNLKLQHDIDVILEFKDFLDIPLSECVRRDSLRENPIGESVIKETFKRYRNFILKQVNSKESKKWVKPKEGLPNAIIVDMDATLCLNIQGRPFYGKGAAEGMLNDIEIPGICDIVRIMHNNGVMVIILTGREGTYEIKDATCKWLDSHNIPYDYTYFRPVNNYTKGDICKYQIYKDNILNKFNILFVLEDSKKCVDMWRNNGLICLQPNEGNF